MKIKQYSLLLLSTGFLVAICSCRYKKSQEVLIKPGAMNGIYSVKMAQSRIYERLELSIRNVSNQSAEFYITPLDINFFNDSTIIRGLRMTEMRKEEKAILLWKFVCHWTYHFQPLSTIDQQINDPAAMLNGFQFGICDDRNAVLSNLARLADVPARVYELSGHVVAEMYYDSSWHMFDADKHIFYTDDNGKIASIAYLSQHPEIIDKKNKELKAVADRVRNKRTKTAVVSTYDNRVNNLYDMKESTYTSSIKLSPESRLLFNSESVTYFERMISICLFSRNGPFYHNCGKQYNKIDLDSNLMIDKGKYILTQQLPYPIKKVNLVTGKSYRVFYSCDGVNWYFKGTTGNGVRPVSFQPFSCSGAGYTLKYFLKLISDDLSERGNCFIENEFTFSDKILIHNPSKAFKVVPQNGAALQMQIKLQVNNCGK